MIYDPYQPPKSDDTATMPLIFSVVVHLLVVGVIIFWQAPKPKPEVAGIEASFFGQADLEAVEGAIRENARLAEQGNNGKDDTSTKQLTPSPETLAINEELARKQAEFEAEMAKFAAELDKEALAEQKEFAKALDEQAKEEQQKLNEAREAFANQDEKVKENQKALDEVRAMRDNAIAEDEAEKRRQGGKSGSLATGTQTTGATSGTNAKSTQGASKGINALKAALEAHIKRHWVVPNNASGERLTANITVDTQGNVLSVSISGGSSALRSSLENAIHNASPLTPAIGSGYTSFKANFTAE